MIAAILLISGWKLLKRLGGLGLVALGILDSSVIPMPGSMDALTIVLSAGNREWWFYYAGAATVGATIGGYLTYQLGRKGGEAALEKKISARRTRKVYGAFERWGFGAVFVPALLPPPIPMVPFLLAAGALNYSPRRFLAALAAGRALRYTLLALLARRFGRHVIAFLRDYYMPILISFIALAVLAGVGVLWYYKWGKKMQKGARRQRKVA